MNYKANHCLPSSYSYCLPEELHELHGGGSLLPGGAAHHLHDVLDHLKAAVVLNLVVLLLVLKDVWTVRLVVFVSKLIGEIFSFESVKLFFMGFKANECPPTLWYQPKMTLFKTPLLYASNKYVKCNIVWITMSYVIWVQAHLTEGYSRISYEKPS